MHNKTKSSEFFKSESFKNLSYNDLDVVQTTPLDERSKQLRRVIIDTFVHGQRGHIGAAFSLVEILRVLYDHVLNYDAQNPRWEKRDRFILSKGHGCLALYALLADKGFFPAEELKNFCKKFYKKLFKKIKLK